MAASFRLCREQAVSSRSAVSTEGLRVPRRPLLAPILLFILLVPSRLRAQDTPNQSQRNSPEAAKLIESAATGDPVAELSLARRYRLGLGLPRDYSQAATWYAAAAKQGLPAAQFGLGYLYEHGQGVARDYSRAADLYRAAAEQGHAGAANNLAAMYNHGLGVPKSVTDAIKW